jgi:SHAQKYF class myb-like DNA-binding protein
MIPVAVIPGYDSGMYPAGQGWNGGEETGIPSCQVGSTYTSLGKLSPVISQADSLSDAADGKIEARGSALRTAIAPVHGDGSLSARDNQAIPCVGNESRPIKACPMERLTKTNVAVGLTFQKCQGQTSESKSRKCSAMSTSGRWTAAEHEAFLRGLKVYGREWKKVATCIPTRTSAQIRSHAQKYFAKASKEQEHFLPSTENHPSSSVESVPLCDQPMPDLDAEKMDSVVRNPSDVETQVCKTLAALRERYKQLEDRLQQCQAPSTCEPPAEAGDVELGSEPAQSVDVVMGPATAALELEQKNLRTAAEARYEMKRKRPSTEPDGSESKGLSRPFVSLTSLPSRCGGFNSNDVIALSMLGGNLGRERIENKTISTIKDENGLNLVIERLEAASK